MTQSLSNMVVAQEAPDYLQHLVTDLNGVIDRLNATITTLQAAIDALEDNDAIHGSGAYGF